MYAGGEVSVVEKCEGRTRNTHNSATKRLPILSPLHLCHDQSRLEEVP